MDFIEYITTDELKSKDKLGQLEKAILNGKKVILIHEGRRLGLFCPAEKPYKKYNFPVAKHA